MPRLYKRKVGAAPRAEWSAESLAEAVRRLRDKEVSLREASRDYGIPLRTLRRRSKSGDVSKKKLGPPGLFGAETERKIVAHIKRLSDAGFAPDRKTVRAMAFQLAEKLGLPHKFNRVHKLAGYDWLQSFLERNPDLSIRRCERSDSRTGGINAANDAKIMQIFESCLSARESAKKSPDPASSADESESETENVTVKKETEQGGESEEQPGGCVGEYFAGS